MREKHREKETEDRKKNNNKEKKKTRCMARIGDFTSGIKISLQEVAR